MTLTKLKSMPKDIIDSVFFTVFTIAAAIIICLTVRLSTVSGESMMPTFHDGDRLIISNILYKPKRGDVVVFDGGKNSGYDNKPIIKRVIALEGDTVKIDGGIIYVKESGSVEFTIVNYVLDMDIPLRDMEDVIVPEGEAFVMGDNVNSSKDSRDPSVGTIDVESILGKVVLRFYAYETVYFEETNEYSTQGNIVFDIKFTYEE